MYSYRSLLTGLLSTIEEMSLDELLLLLLLWRLSAGFARTKASLSSVFAPFEPGVARRPLGGRLLEGPEEVEVEEEEMVDIDDDPAEVVSPSLDPEPEPPPLEPEPLSVRTEAIPSFFIDGVDIDD